MPANSGDLRTPTQPQDCGLAIALPLTQEEVDQDAGKCITKHDYIPRKVNQYKNTQEFWEAIIQPIANVCSELLPIARELGVDVRESATANDLRDLFQSCSVVTIVAHWRGHVLRPDDLFGKEKDLASQILEKNDPISSALRSQIYATQLRTFPPADKLVEILNQLIKSYSSLEEIATNSEVQLVFDDVGLAAANRDVLDKWAGEILKAGNKLELRDGLHTAHDVASMIPHQSGGIIDFATCHSTVLGSRVRQYKPKWRVIINSREVQAVPRLLMLKLLYQQLSSGNYNYGELFARIHKEL